MCCSPAYEAFDAVAHGSVISWQHINLLGEYDFSDEKLQDNVGIRPPKEVKNFGAAEPRYVLQSPGPCRKPCGTLRTFVGI
jgi:hypothetical protein